VLGLSLPATPSLEEEGGCDIVAVEPDRDGYAIPVPYRRAVLIDAIHDGNVLPAQYLARATGSEEMLNTRYATERNWGAGILAGHLAAALHLPAFFRVRTARSLVDFDCLPGVSFEEPPAPRLAIHPPFDRWLDFAQQRRLLAEHYDPIADGLERALRDVRLKLSVHTSDEVGPDGRRNPPVRLRAEAAWPHELDLRERFDPLFPRRRLARTADRLLKARLSFTLEEQGIEVSDAPLQLGSVELRTTVRKYSQQLREAYELAHAPVPWDPEAWDLVWDMISDPELRTSNPLPGFIHHLRQAPPGLEARFDRARRVYHHIAEFARDVEADLARDLHQHFGCVAIEVRRDLVWNSVDGPFGAPRREAVRELARTLAVGVQRYLLEDRPELWSDADDRRRAWSG
jgi:hypothetical protein